MYQDPYQSKGAPTSDKPATWEGAGLFIFVLGVAVGAMLVLVCTYH